MSTKRTVAKSALILGTILGLGGAIYEANATQETGKAAIRAGTASPEHIALDHEIIGHFGKALGSIYVAFLCTSGLIKMTRPAWMHGNEI